MGKIEANENVISYQNVVKRLKCDGCGDEDQVGNTHDWVELSGHHTDWGNDSVDSWVHYDCCSPGCYIVVLENLLSGFKSYQESAEFNDMNYDFAKKLVEYVKELQACKN